MEDFVKKLQMHQMAMELWKEFWIDSDILLRDIRGKEIAKQLTRSIGSISANIEEGYGRGFGRDYLLFLKFSRGSARESKGWYEKSSAFFKPEDLNSRINKLDSIIGQLTKTIKYLEEQNPKKQTGTLATRNP
ncbi:MAG: four helix bundle protein [Bacteroidetes bacterium]|nr:four helix bundle protein [Bacteroidota bacterium]